MPLLSHLSAASKQLTSFNMFTVTTKRVNILIHQTQTECRTLELADEAEGCGKVWIFKSLKCSGDEGCITTEQQMWLHRAITHLLTLVFPSFYHLLIISPLFPSSVMIHPLLFFHRHSGPSASWQTLISTDPADPVVVVIWWQWFRLVGGNSQIFSLRVGCLI